MLDKGCVHYMWFFHHPLWAEQSHFQPQNVVIARGRLIKLELSSLVNFWFILSRWPYLYLSRTLTSACISLSLHVADFGLEPEQTRWLTHQYWCDRQCLCGRRLKERPWWYWLCVISRAGERRSEFQLLCKLKYKAFRSLASWRLVDVVHALGLDATQEIWKRSMKSELYNHDTIESWAMSRSCVLVRNPALCMCLERDAWQNRLPWQRTSGHSGISRSLLQYLQLRTPTSIDLEELPKSESNRSLVERLTCITSNHGFVWEAALQHCG
jgi:hypothetical protein